MKIDDVDIRILKELYDLKPEETQTTTDIAKKLFDTNERWQLRKKDGFVRVRLDKLAGEKLINIEKVNGKFAYTVNKENMLFGKAKLKIEADGEKLNASYDNFCLLNLNGRAVMFEL